MQTRRMYPDHHQSPLLTKEVRHLSSEAELIALARGKGQVLAERTLQIIRETLELRGICLKDFLEDVRPHFRNNILNPSGFLINRARHFLQVSRPAVAADHPERGASGSAHEPVTKICTICNGQKYVITDQQIAPCPECSTPEFRTAWELKEVERAKRARRDP